ncbi:MAG: hypothetical protein LBM73_01730, partial [Candidatus Nomurabacteria bacterium]|nr:hypothetical protein [Candidatus Nomurabacteria bacterium]
MKASKNRLIFALMTVVGDAVAIILAYVLAYIVRVKLSGQPIWQFVGARAYFRSLLILTPLIIIWLS